MARDTRGRMPGATTDLRRVSLISPHWRQARRWLAGQAFVVAVLALVILVGQAIAPPHDGDFVAGVKMTASLGWTLLGIAGAVMLAMVQRRLALVVTTVLSTSAIVLVVISAVAATHQALGPFGSTAPVLLLWAVLFCCNFGITIWLVPDHIEGPAWLPRSRSDRTPTSQRRSQ